jgi:WD40 repeat protein
VSFSADGSQIFASTRNDSLLLNFDIAANRTDTLLRHELVKYIEVDEKFMLTSTDSTVILRNLKGTVQYTYSWNSTIRSFGFLSNSKGKLMSILFENGNLGVWKTSDGSVLGSLMGIGAAVFSEDGKQITVANMHSVEAFEFDENTKIYRQATVFKSLEKYDINVSFLFASTDNTRNLVTFGDGYVRMYRTPRGIFRYLNEHPHIGGFTESERMAFNLPSD